LLRDRKKVYVSPYLHNKLKVYCRSVDERMVNITQKAISTYLKEMGAQNDKITR
jgi:hypothetical protein